MKVRLWKAEISKRQEPASPLCGGRYGPELDLTLLVGSQNQFESSRLSPALWTYGYELHTCMKAFTAAIRAVASAVLGLHILSLGLSLIPACTHHHHPVARQGLTDIHNASSRFSH